MNKAWNILKKIINNPVVFFLLVAAAGFGIGWGVVYLLRDQLLKAVI